MNSRTVARALSLLVSSTLLITAAPAGAVELVDGGQLAGGGEGRWSFNQQEQCIMRKINRIRQRNGRSALRRDKQVGVIARRHANSMASSYSVFHDGDIDRKITNWRSLAQNSGAAGSCKRVFWAFMRSSGHRANILGRWRYMGVGVAKRNGRVFVQQVFEWRRDPGNVYRYP